MGAVQGRPNQDFGRTTEFEQIPTHNDETDAETNPEDDSDAKNQKGPSEKAKETNETKIIFQSSGIVSNLSKTLLQTHSAVKHVSKFEEKLIPDKLASTAKTEPKHVI